MPQPGRTIRMVLLVLGGVLGGLLAAGGVTVAQNAPTGAPTVGRTAAQPPATQPRSAETATPEATTNDAEESFPVFAITSVETLRSPHTSGLDIVVAHGVTSSEGWADGVLVPLSSGTPKDGILDLVLVAKPPEEASTPGSYASILAVLPLPDHPFKAIRVRSATNSVTLKELPGYAEVKPPSDVCGSCVGKHFVAKGAAAPAGVGANEIVREEELPPNTRVLRPADGVGDMRTNPDRLTIVIGDDGRIVDAIWE